MIKCIYVFDFVHWCVTCCRCHRSRWRPLLWPGRYSEPFRKIRSRTRTATHTVDSWCPDWFWSWHQLQTAVVLLWFPHLLVCSMAEQHHSYLCANVRCLYLIIHICYIFTPVKYCVILLQLKWFGFIVELSLICFWCFFQCFDPGSWASRASKRLIDELLAWLLSPGCANKKQSPRKIAVFQLW